MPNTLGGINSTPRSDTLNAVSTVQFAPASAAAAASYNTINVGVVVGVNYKIRKVGVFIPASSVIDGTSAFDLVVGGLAYTSGAATNLATNDNSFDPSSATTVGVNVPVPANPVLGGLGYPTNIAVMGNSVFGTALPINAANFPGIIAGNTYTGAVFVPPNYDVAYPGNLPLTLRIGTGTGTVTNIVVSLVITPIRLRPAPVGSQAVTALPGVDY